MRFNTKSEEFETLKADTLEKLANYVNAVQNATYQDSHDLIKSQSLVATYSAVVQSNAEFRTFLFKDKLQGLLKDNLL